MGGYNEGLQWGVTVSHLCLSPTLGLLLLLAEKELINLPSCLVPPLHRIRPTLEFPLLTLFLFPKKPKTIITEIVD